MVFAEDNSVVSIVTATSAVGHGRVGYGTSVEHLKVLIDEVRRRRPLNTWLDVQSTFEDGLRPRVAAINVSEHSGTSLLSDWCRTYREQVKSRSLFTGPHSVLQYIDNADKL